MPTALAIVLDKPLEVILEALGTDGSEIVRPEMPDPYCRRGFHYQELIDYCMAQGRWATLIESEPCFMGDTLMHPKEILEARLQSYMQKYSGVLFVVIDNSIRHSFAKLGDMIINPATGHLTTLQNAEVIAFLAIQTL